MRPPYFVDMNTDDKCTRGRTPGRWYFCIQEILSASLDERAQLGVGHAAVAVARLRQSELFGGRIQ
jgi:hypothetical protein